MNVTQRGFMLAGGGRRARGSDHLSIQTGALVVAAVAFATSANAILNGFVFDDLQNVLQNPWIRDWTRLGEAFTSQMAAFDPKYQTSYYRPFMHVIFAACYSAFGPKPWGFHLVVLLFHVAASACVYVLLARWAGAPASSESQEPRARPPPGWLRAAASGPLVGGLLFAAHPIHAEAVAWNAGVVDLSYSLFTLLALLSATGPGSGRPHRLFLAPALFFVGLLCKEPGLMLLPLVLAAFAARGDFAVPSRRRDAFRQLAGLAAALIAYLAARINALGSLMGGGGEWRVPVGLVDGMMTAVALFGEYVKTLVAPVRLSAVHGLAVVSTPLHPRFAIGAAIAMGLALMAWRARRHPGAVLGFALLALPLLPALYVPVLGEGLLAERYFYLPSAGAALLVAVALDARPALARCAVVLRAAAAGLTVAVCAAATVQRNAVWRDDRSLWADAVRKEPGSAAAHEYLGYALLTHGQPEAAAASLTRALDLDPGRIDARTNLASALAVLGRSQEAIAHVEAVLRQQPRLAEAHAVLGDALAAQGRLEDAIAAYQSALALNPSLAAVHNSVGIAYAQIGQHRLAVVHLGEAVRLDPGNQDFARNLALLLQ